MDITTATGIESTIPADVLADFEAVMQAVAAGKRPDPELFRRVRERADKSREEIFRKNGLLDIAVPYIRALRDGDDE